MQTIALPLTLSNPRSLLQWRPLHNQTIASSFSPPNSFLPWRRPVRTTTTTTVLRAELRSVPNISVLRSPASSPLLMDPFGYQLMSNPNHGRRTSCFSMRESNANPDDFEEVERQSASDSTDHPSIDVVPQEETITLDFIKKMIEDFKNQKPLDKRGAYEIIKKTREVLRPLPSLVDITVPDGKHITVCGDVHGQFYDFLNIFELNGLPSEDNPYIFNGDFVDRGAYSVEVILTLFAFKCLYPSGIYLVRGNHETKDMNKIYGFKEEVNFKLGYQFVKLFAEVFCCLPLAHVINEKIFVVHGGVPHQDGVKLSDIREMGRFYEPPEMGLMCELLWNDPRPFPGVYHSMRGVGYTFGEDVTKRFLQNNDLELVVRSHEVKDEGYEFAHDGKLITVFSAPNYCGMMGNKGAFIRFVAPEMKPEVVTFRAVNPLE